MRIARGSLVAALAGALSLGACSAGVFAAQTSGLCLTSRRFSTDRELADAALSHVFEQPLATVVSREYDVLVLRNHEVVRPATLAAFRAQVTNCCILTRTDESDGPDISLIDVLTGRARAFVRFEHVQQYRDWDGAILSRTVVPFIPVDNCGNEVRVVNND